MGVSIIVLNGEGVNEHKYNIVYGENYAICHLTNLFTEHIITSFVLEALY